jgi:PAP_fibrillin
MAQCFMSPLTVSHRPQLSLSVQRRPPAHRLRSPARPHRITFPSCQAGGVQQTTHTPPSTAALRKAIANLAGEERGIFNLEESDRATIESLVSSLEALSPTAAPAANNAAAVSGAWRLLYTTLTVLGRKRVRLAIGNKSKPGFVKLGHLYQVVDPAKSESLNIVVFKMALGGSGTFTLTASYESVSDQRVVVQTRSAVLEPRKLEELLGENIVLLTQIFDPTGHLDITYLDDNLRIGRDEKGHLFVLERCVLP